VALARFENLTGEPALETAARVIESELIRGLGTVTQIRVQPIEVSGRRAALAAARAAGAGSVIVGQYLRNGEALEISAEVLLTEQGELFGAVGPVTATAANLRGPGLTELTERLTTGANNVAATLANLPTRIAAVIYARPWPRWPVAVRAQTLRATLATNPENYAEQAQAILAEAPEMLKVKHDLARHLRDQARYDEAQKLFRELLTQDRPKLAEAEIQAIVFDEALLAGDPARALQAAEALLAIRPVSEAITQVVSCLWAQNRPRAAFQAMEQWSQTYGVTLPEAAQFFPKAGLLATKATMHLREGNAPAALAAVEELKTYVAGRAFPTTQLLEFLALGLLGREAEQQRVVREIGAVSGAVRIEPAVLMWFGYCGSLHAGRPAEAKRWLEATMAAWRDTPMEGPQKENFQSLGIWLFEAQGDYAKAMSYVEQVEARQADTPSVVGAKAILLRAMGRTAEAEALRVRLENWEVRNSRGYPAYWRARIAARAGDKARAVELLRLAVSRGLWFGDFQSPSVDLGRAEPEFASLRGYEPYEALLKATN
jgi:tetratricopeptide (TPR) repeat protein